MNSVLILVFNILASSLAEPDPDQHIHVHLQPEDSKGGQSPKAAGGVLVPEDGKGGEAPKTGGGHLADYGGWTPKKCHPHCMPNCHSWCVPPKKNLGSRRGGCRLWQLDPKKMPPTLHAKLPLLVPPTYNTTSKKNATHTACLTATHGAFHQRKPGKPRRVQTMATGLQTLPATVPAADPATVAAQPAHP